MSPTSLPDGVSFLNLYPGLFLERSARVYPDKAAVTYGSKALTYSQFDQRVSQLVGALVRAGIGPGDRVAYLLPNIPELLEGHYGPMRLGAVLVAINTRLSSREISFILRHSGAKALVFDSELSPIVKKALEAVDTVGLAIEVVDTMPPSGIEGSIEYEEFLRSGQGVIAPVIERSELDTIAINYTSGTTGEPKGVEYSGRGAYLNALGQVIDAGLNASSVYLWTLPMFHCNGWCYTWAVTAVGGQHVCLRKVDAEKIFENASRNSVTHMCAAPTVLSILEASDRAQADALKGVRVFTGGAPPSPRILRSMKSMGAELEHLYGLTETYGPCTIAAPQPDWETMTSGDLAQAKSRQGAPVTTSHVGVRVVTENMLDVPADGETVGEVVTRGNTVMKAYYQDVESTREAFAGGWFHTGDLAVVHPDGYIELKDRKKDVIISGGENISSIEVEQVLMEHPSVHEVCVVGVPDERWGEVPKAFVALIGGETVSDKELIEFCGQRLARFKTPHTIEFGELPKTATGKIQKFLLREREWAGHERRIG